MGMCPNISHVITLILCISQLLVRFFEQQMCVNRPCFVFTSFSKNTLEINLLSFRQMRQPNYLAKICIFINFLAEFKHSKKHRKCDFTILNSLFSCLVFQSFSLSLSQMSEGSQVSKVTLCVQKWQSVHYGFKL